MRASHAQIGSSRSIPLTTKHRSTPRNQKKIIEKTNFGHVCGTALTCLSLCVGLSTAQPAQAIRSKMDISTCTQFIEEPDGLKFCETKSGSGESPEAFDSVIVNYSVRAGDKTIESSKGFYFYPGNEVPELITPGLERAVLGDDIMPAMKPGGIRTVIVPPELAYGSKGIGCMDRANAKQCRIPANSYLEIAIEYIGLGFVR